MLLEVDLHKRIDVLVNIIIFECAENPQIANTLLFPPFWVTSLAQFPARGKKSGSRKLETDITGNREL